METLWNGFWRNWHLVQKFDKIHRTAQLSPNICRPSKYIIKCCQKLQRILSKNKLFVDYLNHLKNFSKNFQKLVFFEEYLKYQFVPTTGALAETTTKSLLRGCCGHAWVGMFASWNQAEFRETGHFEPWCTRIPKSEGQNSLPDMSIMNGKVENKNHWLNCPARIQAYKRYTFGRWLFSLGSALKLSSSHVNGWCTLRKYRSRARTSASGTTFDPASQSSAIRRVLKRSGKHTRGSWMNSLCCTALRGVVHFMACHSCEFSRKICTTLPCLCQFVFSKKICGGFQKNNAAA